MKDKRRRNRWIMGTFVGTAAIAVAIDHTRHRLPAPAQPGEQAQEQAAVVIVEDENATPCGLDASPYALDGNPCSLGDTSDAMDESPCSL